MNSLLNKAILVLCILLIVSCATIKTNDPIESYKNWFGQNPPKGVQLINGQYWQSGHWTREYILYLKLQSSKIWWTELIKQNNLVLDSSNWLAPTDAPKWFMPSIHKITWKQINDFQGSRYIQDTLTGNCYIYEIQL